MMEKRPPLYVRVFIRFLLHPLSRLNARIYRMSRGRLGGGVGARRVGLLTTTGRKTGLPRTVPLLCFEDGERVLLVAAEGGMPKHPQWYLNLCANPEVRVTLAGRARSMRARTASEDERAAWWPELTRYYRGWAEYQSWTDRVIPVVVCEPG